MLKERPDMPLERVEAYKQIGELLARVAELEAERAEREKQEPVAYSTSVSTAKEQPGKDKYHRGPWWCADCVERQQTEAGG